MGGGLSLARPSEKQLSCLTTGRLFFGGFFEAPGFLRKLLFEGDCSFYAPTLSHRAILPLFWNATIKTRHDALAKSKWAPEGQVSHHWGR
jgi:hypothetical protein